MQCKNRTQAFDVSNVKRTYFNSNIFTLYAQQSMINNTETLDSNNIWKISNKVIWPVTSLTIIRISVIIRCLVFTQSKMSLSL